MIKTDHPIDPEASGSGRGLFYWVIGVVVEWKRYYPARNDPYAPINPVSEDSRLKTMD